MWVSIQSGDKTHIYIIISKVDGSISHPHNIIVELKKIVGPLVLVGEMKREIKD